MKKGVILYVTGGGEDIPLHDLGTIPFGILRQGIAAAHVATSEDELVYWWWYMTTRGMHHVSCIAVTYDAALQRFKFLAEPMRLYG